ncbi:PGPGW domain-containing protein [uncultured Thiothrix sp.]|uniref:PGPGW domain-containing protein n=1 Tax=uncultured Thiothrix sp. TaxID=223185 RepID=UPI0026196D23|nr:PGPGW domain-containing protein [uncultured Thiothrix sp.]
MLDNITDWLIQHDTLLYWIGSISLLMFVLSLLLLPILINKIPVDYFTQTGTKHKVKLLSPITMVRNLLGLLMLLAGVAMLVLPGQGVLTMLIGLTIMNFPGKYSLERWVVTRKGVLEALNWIRAKSGVALLRI